MGKTITIAVMNQKGGVGKSTTTEILATEFAKRGFNTGAVDADAQANMTNFFNVDKQKSIYDLITNTLTVEELSVKVRANLTLLRSHINLAAIDMAMVNHFGAETKLLNCFSELKDKYDVVVYDCPPALNKLTAAIIASVDYIIIPLTVDSQDAIAGYEILTENISDITKVIGCKSKKFKALISKFIIREKATIENLKIIKEKNINTFDTYIRNSTTVKAARNKKKTAIEHLPNSPVANDFTDFFNELLIELNVNGGN
jgi:ATPases involved in chromosome partitioning